MTTEGQVIEAARKHVKGFRSNLGGFEDRGILNSEMLAICSLSEELGVEVFIESGRWRGQSTEVLSKYFAGKNVIIESIELFRDENALHVEEKMKNRKNVNLLYGDANSLVPSLIKKYLGKKIVILFDGPKGQQAIDVFRLAVGLSDSVCAGFFHDMRKPTPEMPNESRAIMNKVFPNSFYSDNKDFLNEFKELDESCTTAQWAPYAIAGKPIGSYGPTVGIVFISEEDRGSAKKDSLLLTIKSGYRILQSWGVKCYHALKAV